MTSVTLMNVGATQALDIVHELRAQGYVQGKDFDFSYHQAFWDGFGYAEGNLPKHTIFKFYNKTHASWFALKYTS